MVAVEFAPIAPVARPDLARVARLPRVATRYPYPRAGANTGILRTARDADDLPRYLESHP